MDIGIKALNTCPVKSIKRKSGEINVPVEFGGITSEGEYIYADADGIL
jgi:regulator of ribonuclease activity A